MIQSQKFLTQQIFVNYQSPGPVTPNDHLDLCVLPPLRFHSAKLFWPSVCLGLNLGPSSVTKLSSQGLCLTAT